MAAKDRTICVQISEDAHKVLRRFRIEGGMTARAVVELALVKLATDVGGPSRPIDPELSTEAV